MKFLAVFVALGTLLSFFAAQCVKDSDDFIKFNKWLTSYGYETPSKPYQNWNLHTKGCSIKDGNWELSYHFMIAELNETRLKEINDQLLLVAKFSRAIVKKLSIACFYHGKYLFEVVLKEKDNRKIKPLKKLSKEKRLAVYYQVGKYLLEIDKVGGYMNSSAKISLFDIYDTQPPQIGFNKFYQILKKERQLFFAVDGCPPGAEVSVCYDKLIKITYANIMEGSEIYLRNLQHSVDPLKELSKEATEAISKVRESTESFEKIVEQIGRLAKITYNPVREVPVLPKATPKGSLKPSNPLLQNSAEENIPLENSLPDYFRK